MIALLRIDFQGRGEVEAFSWAPVQAMRDSVQLALGWPDKSVPLERYWRNNPFVFSLVPRCHRFGLANVRREVRNKLERTGAMERSGTNFVFPTLNLARDPFLSRTRA